MSPANIQFIASLFVCNLLALLLGITLILSVKLYNKRGNSVVLPVSNRLLLILIAYFVSIASITIIPLPYSNNKAQMESGINLVPFIQTIDQLFDPAKRQDHLMADDVLENIMGNIFMFMPLGILLPLANPKYQSYKRIFIFTIICSSGIEIAQFFSQFIGNYRQTDIDDVIFNTIGAMIGYFIYAQWFGLGQKDLQKA